MSWLHEDRVRDGSPEKQLVDSVQASPVAVLVVVPPPLGGMQTLLSVPVQLCRQTESQSPPTYSKVDTRPHRLTRRALADRGRGSWRDGHLRSERKKEVSLSFVAKVES